MYLGTKSLVPRIYNFTFVTFRANIFPGFVQKSSNNKTQGDKIENLGSGKTWGRLRSWENYSAQAQDESEACLLEVAIFPRGYNLYVQ